MRILATDGIDKSAVQELNLLGHDVIERHFSPEDLPKALFDYDVIVVRSATKITPEVIDGAVAGNRLKMIIRAGVGVDNIDVKYAVDNGLTVMNTPNSSSASVAELALAHILALSRFVGISNYTMRNSEWNKKQYTGVEINGKILGLIGFGRISKELAKRAKALGMRVIYTNRSGINEEFMDYEYRMLDDLLRESDYVSIHTPSTEDGKPLIGIRELSLMKPTAFIINLARGGIVDEKALLHALNEGLISGAGLDVYSIEPNTNIELVTHPKVSCTPHIGGSTHEAQMRIGSEIVEIIKNNL